MYRMITIAKWPKTIKSDHAARTDNIGITNTTTLFSWQLFTTDTGDIINKCE